LRYLLILFLLLASCAEEGSISHPPGPGEVVFEIAGGHVVYAPQWFVDDWPLEEALAEIEAEAVVLSSHYSFRIRVPVFIVGQIPAYGSHEAGHIEIGMRHPKEGSPVVFPALKHEIGHALYGPCAGHPCGDNE
jgi:hypothetical protein